MKKTEIVPVSQKDLTTEKTKATKAVSYATNLTVVSKEDYDAAMEEGKKIKTILETVTSRREEITKPMNDALKSTRSLFKPIEVNLEDALTTIKAKMTTWFKTEKERELIEQQKLAKKVEEGKMKPETAIKKAATIEAPETHTKTETASSTMRTVTKYRVVDKRLIPHMFLEPNMVAIKQSFRSGQPVPGVEAYEEQELAIS